jgi:HEAT repeat protein
MAKPFVNLLSRITPKRRWFQFSLCTLFIAVTLFGVWLGDWVDPVRKLERQLRDESEQVRTSAAQKLGALGSGGKAAEGSLVLSLNDQSLRVRSTAAWAISRIGGSVGQLVPLLSDPADKVRLSAAEAIVWSGGDITQVIPTLLDLLANKRGDSSRTRAEEIFSAFGPEPAGAAIPMLLDFLADDTVSRSSAAVEALKHLSVPADVMPVLIETLRHESPKLRIGAAELILRMGPQTNEAASVLRDGLHDDDPYVAAACAAALSAGLPDNAEFLAVLTNGLRSEDAELRLRSAQYLEVLGPAATAAVDELAESLDDESEGVSRQAASTLRRIGPTAVPALERVVLRDAQPRVRFEAIFALWHFGPAAHTAVPALIVALEDQDDDVRTTAVLTLAAIGKRAAPAVPRLSQWLWSDDAELRQYARHAVETIGVLDGPTRTQLTALLSSEQPKVRLTAARILAACDESNDVLLPLIIRLAACEDVEIASGAMELLGKLGPRAAPAIGSLVTLLTTETNAQPGFCGGSNCHVVAGILSKIGPPAVPPLAEALKHRNPQVRGAAAGALGEIGPAAHEAVPQLIALLGDHAAWESLTSCLSISQEVRENAIESLGRIGPRASAAIASLVPLLKETSPDGSTSLRTQVVTALGQIGPAARGHIPTLIALAKSDDLDLSAHACMALARIEPENEHLVPCLKRFLAAAERESALDWVSLDGISEVIWELGAIAQPLATDLRRMVMSSPILSRRYRCQAAYALARFPEERSAAIRYLQGLAGPEDYGDAWVTDRILQKIKVKINGRVASGLPTEVE